MIIPESLLKDLGRLFVWFPLRWTIKNLPPTLDFAAIKYTGRLYYFFGNTKAAELRRNISSVFHFFEKPLMLKEMLINSFESHFLNQYLVFLFPKFDKKNISQYHSFSGLQHLEKALENGKGCIIIHAHFGPAQLPLVHFTLKGLPVSQIGYHPDGKNLSFIGNMVKRKKIAMEMDSRLNIIMADSFLRPIFQHLKKNGIVMITGDGVGGGVKIGKYCPVSFLDKTILFPKGPARLSQKTGALLLPAFTIPAEGNRFKTVIRKPLNFTPTGNLKENVINVNTQAFATVMEQYIKKYPYHWHFWDEFRKGKLLL